MYIYIDHEFVAVYSATISALFKQVHHAYYRDTYSSVITFTVLIFKGVVVLQEYGEDQNCQNLKYINKCHNK